MYRIALFSGSSRVDLYFSQRCIKFRSANYFSNRACIEQSDLLYISGLFSEDDAFVYHSPRTAGTIYVTVWNTPVCIAQVNMHLQQNHASRSNGAIRAQNVHAEQLEAKHKSGHVICCDVADEALCLPNARNDKRY